MYGNPYQNLSRYFGFVDASEQSFLDKSIISLKYNVRWACDMMAWSLWAHTTGCNAYIM